MVLADFGASTNYGSTLDAGFNIVCAIMAVPVGLALNKWGFRKVGYLGYIVLLLTAIAGATFINDQVSLVILRCLQGVGYAIPPILGIYLVTQWFPKDKQGVPVALVGMMSALAKVLSQQMAKVVFAVDGTWHTQFMVFAVLCVVGMLLFMFFMKPGPGYAVAEAERLAKASKKKGQEKAPIVEVLKNPMIWAVIIIMVCFSIGQRGFSPFSNMIYIDNCGVSDAAAADINSVFSLIKIPSGLLFGYILSRFLKIRGRVSAVMLTVYFFGMLVPFVMNQEWMAWAFAIVVGLVGGVAGFCNVCMPIFSKSPAELAMGLSIFTLVGKYLAGIVAPYIISFVQTATGSWFYCFIPVFVCAVVATAAVWFLGVKLDRRTKLESAGEAA